MTARRGRSRIAPEVEAQIRERLLKDDSMAQIRRDLGVGYSAIDRIFRTIEEEQQKKSEDQRQKRRVLLVQIAKRLVGSGMEKKEVADLIFKATGERLTPRGDE